MQTSLNQPQVPPQKVRNILVRHSCSSQVRLNSTYQHPETSYILKYAPKYYKSLSIQATCQSPFLSKVKKIKKLQRFTGSFDRSLPQQLWFDLLGNNRKEIEEVPQIYPNKTTVSPNFSFWERLNQQKLKHFWNVTRVWLPKWGRSFLIHDLDNFLSCKESFVKHVWNLRKLKSLRITVKFDNYDNVKWVLGKLDGMNRLFKRLEILNLNIYADNNLQELFQNKTFLSHLTGLSLFSRFDPIFAEIPQVCKKLDSFSFNFQSGIDDDKPEFRSLLTSLQQLSQLKSLGFSWPAEKKNFWSYFKPQPSLEYLCLTISTHNLRDDGLFEEDKLENIVAHWEDLKELKALEFSLSCSDFKEFSLGKIFMTKVLGKAQKLETLKFWVGAALAEGSSQEIYEPFIVADVSHLYETLERFEYQFYSWTENRFTKFDLRVLEPFKSLKSMKLEGNIVHSNGDVEAIVRLLEEREYPVLELNLKGSIDSPVDWLRNTLEGLERTKRADRNLKVILDLKFEMRNYLEVLEGLCCEIQSAKRIKGLEVLLSFNEDYDCSHFSVENVKEVLNKYPGMRNINISLSNYNESLEFMRIDGEKEQFFINTH